MNTNVPQRNAQRNEGAVNNKQTAAGSYQLTVEDTSLEKIFDFHPDKKKQTTAPMSLSLTLIEALVVENFFYLS